MKRILIKQKIVYFTVFLLILNMSILFQPSSNLNRLGEKQALIADSQNEFHNSSNFQGLQAVQDLLNNKINTPNELNLDTITEETEDFDLNKEYLNIMTASGENLQIPFPTGFNTIQSFSVKGHTTLFINDRRGGDKIEAQLRDYSFLWQEGYINEDRIKVIVLPGSPVSDNINAVKPLSKSDISLMTQQLQPFGGIIKSTFKNFPFLSIELPYDEIFKLAEQNFISHVFLDKKVHICLDQSVPIIKPPANWQELETQFGFEINGTNVRIAVLDTGIDKTHPDLDDLDDNPVTSDPKVIAEACFTDESHTWDGYGHGTHCASIAAGTGVNSSDRYVGVAPGALLLNGKVLTDGGSGYFSWIISGIEWAVDQSADIISMSLGKDINGDGTDPLSLAIDWATDQGVVCAVAAGNAGSWGGMFSVGIPAVAKRAITVGSTTKTDEISSFSSQGPTEDYRIKPDVCAPGSAIIAARANGTNMGSPINNYYTSASGTSMATPHVAGAAALILQTHPDWNPLMIKSALMGNTEILTNEHLWRQGAGRIDVCNATNTTLLIIEPSISLGLLEREESSLTTFILMNLANTVTMVDLSTYTTCEGNETNYVSLNATSLMIPANTNASISFEVGPFDEDAPEGWYEGWINVSNSQNNKTSPYLFMSMSTLSIRVFDTDNSTPIYAAVALVTYPNISLIEIQSTYEGDWGPDIDCAKFHLKGGEYAVCAQAAWIDNGTWGDKDFSRMFMLEKNISIPKNSNLNISLSLAETQMHSIPTIDSLGNNLTVHSYTQSFCGGPQTWYGSYFQQSEWSLEGGWFGIDLNVSHLTFYSTNYTPPDRLCEALGYYASNSLFSEVYLVPLKYWNVSSLPSILCYPQSDYAKYHIFYNMPETYPENGLNSMNQFWFTWDHIGGLQIWVWDVHNVPAGINATYYLAPGNGTYFGYYMTTYKGWSNYNKGPLQEWYLGKNYPYPQIPLDKGETANMILGNFSFAPYHPGLNISVLDTGTEFLLNLTGDIWSSLSWPIWWLTFPPLGYISPFPQYYANYSLFVNELLFDQGLLNGKQGYNGEPFIHYPPNYLDVDWCGIAETWNITTGEIRLQLTLPSIATLCSRTIYNLTFTLGSGDSTPPMLNGIFCPTNFTPGQDLYINFTAFDVGLGIDTHFLKYSFNNGTTWQAAIYEDPYYRIPCESADALTILINVTDQAGNSLQYLTNPIALCNKVKLNVPTEIFAFTGDPVSISGTLTSLEGNGLASMVVSLTNENISYAMTNNNGNFTFNLKAPNLAGNYIYNITSSSVGLYNGEEVSIELQVSVDTIPPSWVELPTDQFVEFGDNFLYDLNATDLAGISTWWLNDTVHFTINGNGVIMNAVSLSVGVYGLQVWVNDTHNLIQSAIFSLIAQDTIAPSWEVIPTDQTLQYGEALDYQLTATDLSGIDHWVISDTTHFAISSTGRLTNTMTLNPGTYILNIAVYDPYGNYCNVTITITVQEQPEQEQNITIPASGFFVIITLAIVIPVLGLINRRKIKYQ